MLQTPKSKICRPAGVFLQKIGKNPHVLGFLQNYAGFLQVFRDSSDDFLQKRAPFLQKTQKSTLGNLYFWGNFVFS